MQQRPRRRLSRTQKLVLVSLHRSQRLNIHRGSSALWNVLVESLHLVKDNRVRLRVLRRHLREVLEGGNERGKHGRRLGGHVGCFFDGVNF